MRGVVYVAYGQPAVRCLIQSVLSLRVHEPDIKLLVLTDKEVRGMPCHIVPTDDIGARSVKTRLHQFVPLEWERILYMDVDTVILKPLTRFFDPLDLGWDMVFCRDEHAAAVCNSRLKLSKEIRYTTRIFGSGQVSQFAGGLFSWVPNRRTRSFFEIWHEEWKIFRYRDQGALTRAISKVPLKMWPVGFAANAKHKDSAIEVWHRHGQARRSGSV